MEETQSELRQRESHRDLNTQTLRKSLPLSHEVQTELRTLETPYVIGKGIKPQQREPESLCRIFTNFRARGINKLLLKGLSQQSFHPLRGGMHSLKGLSSKSRY